MKYWLVMLACKAKSCNIIEQCVVATEGEYPTTNQVMLGRNERNRLLGMPVALMDDVLFWDCTRVSHIRAMYLSEKAKFPDEHTEENEALTKWLCTVVFEEGAIQTIRLCVVESNEYPTKEEVWASVIATNEVAGTPPKDIKDAIYWSCNEEKNINLVLQTGDLRKF